MKKYFILALCAITSVGLITGCGSKEEEKETGNKPYKEKLDSGATVTLYDNDGKVIDEDGFIGTIGYVIDKGENLVTVSYEKDTNNLVVTGKKSGDAEVTVYYFDENEECLSETTLRLNVDKDLNVKSTGFAGGYGTCEQDIEDVTILK